MVHALRGMYAFAIWDERDRSMFLARDPFGIKPLYYADDGRSLRFASQVKALLKGGAVDTAPEPAGSVGFVIWGTVPEPYTLYRGIRSLPAGAHLRVTPAGQGAITRYFDVADEFRNAEHMSGAAVSNAAGILHDGLADSIRHHLVADVPVGLFLSAGHDSSILAGLSVQQPGPAPKAVTLGFPEYQGTHDDEVPIARMVAQGFGLDHEAHWIKRSDFDAELPKILDAMDQPSIDGVNAYFVSRAAAQAGLKVAFSGLGGDELFGGYPSFAQVPQLAGRLGFLQGAPIAGRLARRVLAPILSVLTSPKYAGLLEYGGSYGGAYLLRRALFMPWEATSILDPATVAVGLEKLQILENLQATVRGLRQPRSRIAALEFSWYLRNQLLRDADWAGMAHSLEIRVPLVDVQLFRTLAPLMVSERYPTKADFAAVLPVPLPEKVLVRAKTGFTTPVRQWISGTADSAPSTRGLRGWAQRVLPPQPRMFRALALVSDVFGGTGGIAKFNRDLLTKLASMPECAEEVVTPRLIAGPIEDLPPKVRFVAKAAGGKIRFVRSVLAEAFRGHLDFVISGHINLAALTALVAGVRRAPSLLIVHGIDAWTRRGGFPARRSLSRFTVIAGVSNLTLTRFGSWASVVGVDVSRLRLLPNCIDARKYGPGPKPRPLAERLGLEDRTVIMTLGRLATEERYKGFDEILEALPALAKHVPDISYLICGDGADRQRLEDKAVALNVRDRVVFTGFVPEEQKPDYYRLADAYVMPSRGEGFGIVLLEALACGIPALGSRLDGSQEALLAGALGYLADPSNLLDVEAGVLETLRRGTGKVPEALNHYSHEAFARRTESIVREALVSH